MGFKDWWDAQNERNRQYKAWREHDKAQGKQLEKEHGRFDVSYSGAYLKHGLFSTQGCVEEIAGATAEFELGADQKATTLTRVAAGAIIAGPVGAIVGGMFKKDKGRAYVTVTFPNGRVAIVDGPVSDEAALRAFAQKLNVAGRHYAAVAT